MLRVAIPYGLLSSRQLRTLASIARRYDRGYGHFTTRQNIQFNWPRIEDVPDILADLAAVEMHAIQTSGNCIRNITSDPLAGVAPEELEDPRPWCEIIRQWSTFHPEFTYLPRKFKIAVTGAARDRAASQLHDIGVHIVRGASGRAGLRDPGGRRPRPHAGHRPGGAGVPAPRAPAVLSRGDPARLQPRGPARQHPQGTHQDPGEVRSASRSFGGASRPNGSRSRTAAPRTPMERSSGCAASSPRLPTAALARYGDPAAGQDAAFRAWYRYNTQRSQGARLPHRVHLAEEARRGAGRCDRRADGADRGSRRPLQLRRSAGHAHAESGARRRRAGQDPRAVAGARRRPGSRRPTSAR